MRIVYYSTPSFADCDFPLIKALRQRGVEVYYIVRIAPFSKQSTLFDFDSLPLESKLFPASGFPELTKWKEWIDIDKSYVSNDAVGKTGPASIRLFSEEMRLIKSLKPDYVHYVGIPLLFHFSLLAKYNKNDLCVIHDPIPHSGEEGIRYRLKRLALSIVSGKFVLLNNLQGDAFCRRYHVSKNRVRFASLGAYECYSGFGSGRQIPGRFILFFGRLSPYKGIRYALDAFNHIKDKFPDVRIIIAGAGPLCFDWAQYSGKRQFELIHRYLSVDEIADYVRSAEFVVCPYTDATQSGVVNTAFALGTPVLATRVGTMPVVVKDGINGLTVPPSDTDSLSKAMSDMLSNPEMLSAMHNNIMSSLSEGTWTDIADTYISIYTQR